ncbi:hypothetical protein [Thermosipho africanus]|jgi:succinyl-CoA synthetase alpha subunit|uniref:hypothetical protein n=1 Tax=Thermosipho africanus TaxID=2421 RepID=UPI00031D57DF|nr:hypothetical protein [Thermosipho africanus]
MCSRYHWKIWKISYKKMIEYGTNIVCGASKNNKVTNIENIPVFDNMFEAVKKYKCDTSVVFVPALYAKSAIFEAIDSGIKKIITITEHIQFTI